jgi:predicted transcriptional regulator YheO
MSDLLDHLLAAPVALVVALSLFSVLVIVLMALFIWGFTQGRELQFWPPKIGGLVKPAHRTADASGAGKIQGSRLFTHEGYYPIDLAPKTNQPSLNAHIFTKAIHHFLHEVEDRLAAMDLVYLREDNLFFQDVLPPEHHKAYDALIDKYQLHEFKMNHAMQTQRLFNNAIRIVEDLGDMLRGVHFEVILHDVRNPIRSVLACKNTEGISNRRKGDPSTRFVVQYLRHQGKQLIALQADNKVAYPKFLYKDTLVKATTTPLFDDQYGLIGILCFNIHVNAITALSEDDKVTFFANYTQTHGEPPDFERDEAPDNKQAS